jgi:acyl-CoA thioester hydrolase
LRNFDVEIRVHFPDVDSMGIVYHTNYIKWFEIGRIELLRNNGVIYKQFAERGYHLPLTEVYCNYLLPARYDEIVVVETSLELVRGASMRFTYVIWDVDKKERFVEGYTVHACTNTSGKMARIPSDIIEKLNSG